MYDVLYVFLPIIDVTEIIQFQWYLMILIRQFGPKQLVFQLNNIKLLKKRFY